MLTDLRFAFRQLIKTPGFTVTALATLAICLGANLTIFAVIDSVLLRPLPFPDADRLAVMYNSYPRAGKDRDLASVTNYYERRGNIAAFSSIAALSTGATVVGEAGSTERTPMGRVTPEFFSTLGVTPVMGRSFTDGEMTYKTDEVAILTDSYWRTHFNADPQVLGREIRSDGIGRKIVGVLPPDFRFLSSAMEFFLPLSTDPEERNLNARHSNNAILIGRLRPGATLGDAQAQIDASNAAHAAEFPYAKEVAATGFHTVVAPLHADHVASIRPTLLLLQAGGLLLLLIGAVNLINLLLIRASSRVKERAIRQSMGATRRHVITEVLTETVLLTTLGGLAGLAVGAAGIDLLAVLGASQLPLGAHIAFDGRTALVALLGAIGLGGVIALPIAWFNLHSHLASALRSESRSGTANRSAQRLRHGFIVAQITLAFVLLTGAGLLGLSLQRALSVAPGYRADHTLTGQFSLPWKSYQDESTFLGFADRLLAAVQAQPGVSAAAIITDVPLDGSHNTNHITVEGYAAAPGTSIVLHDVYGVIGDYFPTMGIPLREGRFLSSADSHLAQQTCVVDETFARDYWPHGGALGQHLYTDSLEKDPANAYTIVGVVGAVKQSAMTDNAAPGAVYFPFSRFFARNYFLVARTSLAPAALGPVLGRIVRQIDPELPLNDLRSMEVRISDSLVARRSPALLTGIFAGVALLLAALGTYGVLSYAVAQREREIGIRMALGAQPGQVSRQFLALGGRLLAAGTALGVFGAWLAGRAMQGILFDVPAFQLTIVAGTAVVLGSVSLVACVLPARRATRVDPLVALRAE